MENLETLRKRLLYQSQHRGIREMDFLLGGFAQKKIQSMNEEDLKKFERLLTIPDQDLFSLFFERGSLPQDAPQDMVQMIQEYIEFL